MCSSIIQREAKLSVPDSQQIDLSGESNDVLLETAVPLRKLDCFRELHACHHHLSDLIPFIRYEEESKIEKEISRCRCFLMELPDWGKPWLLLYDLLMMRLVIEASIAD